MLSDPPQKPRFHALEKPGPAFADWSSFCAYTDRLARINQRLEREDIQARELRYKNELKTIAAKRSPVHVTSPPRSENVEPLSTLQQLPQKISSRLREIERSQREYNLAEARSRASREEELKQKEVATTHTAQAQTAQIEMQHATEVAAQRAMRLAAARISLQDSIEARKARTEAEMRSIADCQAQARVMAEKEEERRREAIERVRAAHWYKDSQAEERTLKLHAALALQRKTREQRRMEKGCKEQVEKERMATETAQIQCEKIKRETAQMLKTQMEEKAAAKQVGRLEEIIRERKNMSCDVQHDQMKREEVKREQQIQLKTHQRLLYEQLESNRQRRFKQSDMNQVEADINGTAPVRMDYVRPSHDLIAGLPGLGISHDRARHLENLDRNIEEQAQRLDNFLRSSLSLGPKKHSLQIAASDPRLANILKRSEYAMLDAPARLAFLDKQSRKSNTSALGEEAPLEELNAYELIRRRSKNSTVGFLINSFKGEEI